MPRELIYTQEPGDIHNPGQLIEVCWRRGLGDVQIGTIHECPDCTEAKVYYVHITQPHLIGKLKRVIVRAGEQAFMDVPD